MVTNAAQDYRLDYKVKTTCKRPILSLCSEEKKLADASFFESGVVISCLKKNMKNIDDRACKTEIIRVAGVQAENLNANKATAKKCIPDLLRLCHLRSLSVEATIRT